MIHDFRPAPRRTESLQENKNNLKVETTPQSVPPAVSVPSAAMPAYPTAVSPAPTQPAVSDFAAYKAAPPEPTGRFAKLKAMWPPSKKQAAIGLGIFILLGSGAGAIFALTNKPEPVAVKQVVKVKPTPPPAPTIVTSNLSGMVVEPIMNTKPVIGVIVENSVASRPQSGLSQAGVVYEAIAEGGITRFLALYQETNPAEVGPIRSVRPYFLHWLMGFDAAVAHVGGSPEALQNIKDWGTRDLDQFSNSGSYRRSPARPAPHNVYSSLDTFTQLAQAKGFASSTFTPWARKKEAPGQPVTARTIDFAISSPLYNVHYDYDAATNSYKRTMGGTPHLDVAGNTQISPKVVIGLVMNYGIQADGKHSEYGTIGSGQAYVYQDGTVTVGQWNKPDIKSPMTFTDAAGKPLALNPGQTWLTAVTPNKITAAP